MLNLSNSFESAETCPHRARLVDAGALFSRFFEEQGLKTDISITHETVKAYPVLFIEPTGQTCLEDIARVIDSHGELKSPKYSTTLNDIAVRVEDEEHTGFLMMASMVIVQDIAHAIIPKMEMPPVQPSMVAAPAAMMR